LTILLPLCAFFVVVVSFQKILVQFVIPLGEEPEVCSSTVGSSVGQSIETEEISKPPTGWGACVHQRRRGRAVWEWARKSTE